MTNDTSSTAAVPNAASFVSTSVDHPRLINADASSVRTFLRQYDQYVTEVKERAQQLVATGSVTTEAVRPVNLKFCVDADYLESVIELGLIKDGDDQDAVTSVEALTSRTLRSFLNSKVKENKDTVDLSSLDSIIKSQLKMDMSDRNAQSRVENLFISYRTLLRRNGLGWIVSANQKVAVQHVLSAVRPASLQARLKSNLEFSHTELKKDFSGFMKHAVKLSEAFQLVDNGPPKSGHVTNDRFSGSRGGNPKSSDTVPKSDNKNGSRTKKDAPLCLYEPCRAKGLKHWLNDCTACPEHEKTKVRSAHAAKLALIDHDILHDRPNLYDDGNVIRHEHPGWIFFCLQIL